MKILIATKNQGKIEGAKRENTLVNKFGSLVLPFYYIRSKMEILDDIKLNKTYSLDEVFKYIDNL